MSAASFVTTAAVGIAYLAVVLRPLLSWRGFDARTKVPTSVMNDVVQLDLVSSAMFVLVSTLALVVVRYSRTYLAGQRPERRALRARRRPAAQREPDPDQQHRHRPPQPPGSRG